MSVEIKWLGHASFRIAGQAGVVYIDPWKLEDEPHDADVVVVSHSHFDHCSPPDVAKVSTARTTVIAPGDTIEQLPSAKAVRPGEAVTEAGITVQAVAAYNVAKAFHPKANSWIGAVITIDGKRIYYAGDTDLIDEMGELADVDLALLPVGGTYTLDGPEAAQACKTIGPKAAVPYHWGDIVGSPRDAKGFLSAIECQGHLLQPGESLTL